MIKGFVEYEGSRYCFATNGSYEGAMVSDTANVNGTDYLFTSFGRLHEQIKNTPTWIYDMNVGKFRYMLTGGSNETYATNTLITLKDTTGADKEYIFDLVGYLQTGSVIYNGKIYYVYDQGPKYGQVMMGDALGINIDGVGQNAIFTFDSVDNSLKKITILN